MDTFLSSLRTRGLKVVTSSGPTNARIVIVGEALGQDEERLGVPFVGLSGQMLDKLLRAIGLNRNEIFVTNVITIRPPDDKVERLGELGVKREDFYPSLKERLEMVKPNVVLALGVTALEALTGITSISEYRGSILESSLVPGLKVIPSFHPAMILYMGDDSAKQQLIGKGAIKYDYGSARQSLIYDIDRVKEESKSAIINVPIRNYLTNASWHSVLEFIGACLQEPKTAFDLETANCEITHVGLAYSPNLGMSICLASYDQVERERIWLMLKELFRTHRGLVAQNGPYDMTHLQPFAPVNILHFDTMLAHHWLYPELPHALAFLTSIYTKEPYYKDQAYLARSIYNCKDACTTFETAERLEEELREFGKEEGFYGFVMPLLHSVLRMSWTGIRVDEKALKQFGLDMLVKIYGAEQKLNELVGREINANSPKQVATYIYDELKCPIQYHRKRRNKTTDEQALTKLYSQTNKEGLKAILDVREAQKMYSTYAQIDRCDDRIYTSFSVTGTDTGRLSSRQTSFGLGANLQNIPPEFRFVFIPDEGLTFVECDLKQAEAYLVAAFAREPNMLKVFLNDGDIHTENALRIFNKKEVSQEERYLAKRMVHACNYGLGPQQFGVFVGCSTTEAKSLIGQYFNAFPLILEWHKEIERMVNETRTLENPFGRKRQFFGRPGPDLYRKAYAFLPQSTSVDYLDHALIRIEQRLRGDILLQGHDSLLIQTKEEDLASDIKILTEELSVPITINGLSITIGVEIKVGPSWGKLEKWEAACDSVQIGSSTI